MTAKTAKHNPLRKIPKLTRKRRDQIKKFIDDAAEKNKFPNPSVDYQGIPTQLTKWGFSINTQTMGAKEQVEAKAMLQTAICNHADAVLPPGLPVTIGWKFAGQGWMLGCWWEFNPEYHVTG